MNRRIVLVDFYWTRKKDPRLSLGHASILANLREREGLDVRSFSRAVNGANSDADKVASDIFDETQDMAPTEVDVAFGAYVWGEKLLQQVLPRLRALGFRGRIILGGPQISYREGGLERIYPDADAFIRGYAEEALAQLATTARRIAIPGVHWAGEPDAREQAEVDLEALPSPWLTETMPLEEQTFVRWETQRGCPFRCTFCQHREPGAQLPKHALDRTRIEAEIDLFCKEGVNDIAVLDPIFNMAPHAVDVLERFAEHGFKGRLSLQCRAELVDEAFLDAASALNVCLEFGLQTIDPEEGRAIGRPNNMERVDAALKEVRSRGIHHEVSLIFGLPLQTLESFERSVAWCLEREVPVIKAFPLLLLRGTQLERDADVWDLEDNAEPEMPLVLGSSSFNVDDWRAMAQISEALLHTEGNHPKDLGELRALAAEQEPDLFRWIPPHMQEAA